MDFQRAFEVLIGTEGGYVNDPNDPGGETKFGISKRAHPHLDIAALTLQDARAIYLRDYWGPAGCDAMPDGARLPVFDMAVNSGVRPAIRAAQRACGEVEDGILGPLTLQALQAMPGDRFAGRFAAARLLRYTDDPGWRDFGKGWTRRVAQLLLGVPA